ncbi:MAG: hypothetical protein ABSH08_07280 [Tepidisphaeraceae bacterium]
MEISNAYVVLRGKSGERYRKVLQLDLLPIVEPVPSKIDAGDYGNLTAFAIDASRLSEAQRQRLIDWIVRDGDDQNRERVAADVEANKAMYNVGEGDEPGVIIHDPNAWG